MPDANNKVQQLKQTEHFYVAQTSVDDQNRTLCSLVCFDCHIGSVLFFIPSREKLENNTKIRKM